jgi:hypothetical protein
MVLFSIHGLDERIVHDFREPRLGLARRALRPLVHVQIYEVPA